MSGGLSRAGKEIPLQTLLPWVHILSFSVWVGANLFVLGMLCPASRGLPSDERPGFMRRAASCLNAVVAAAAPLAVLSGSGAFWLQGTAPGSGAFFVLAAKTLLTALMALNHGLQAFRYHACLEDPLDGRNPWMRLLVTNAVLGVVVLLLGLALRRVAL